METIYKITLENGPFYVESSGLAYTLSLFKKCENFKMKVKKTSNRYKKAVANNDVVMDMIIRGEIKQELIDAIDIINPSVSVDYTPLLNYLMELDDNTIAVDYPKELIDSNGYSESKYLQSLNLCFNPNNKTFYLKNI